MEGITVEPITGSYDLLEGPHWDHHAQKLYFVDILSQKILRLDPKTGNVTSIFLENGSVGVVVPVEGQPSKFVAGCLKDLVLVDWDSEKSVEKYLGRTLATVDSENSDIRFNDGKVDASGRFWGGTMATEKSGVFTPEMGCFYSVGSDLVPKKQIDKVSISNGLAWNKEDNILYYIDSLTYQIAAYDYDAASATISNRRVIFELQKNDIKGMPDGMTIDTDGNLWVAVFFGSCVSMTKVQKGQVLNINPRTGKLIRKVTMPAENITSVAFGGENLDVLYVTSASRAITEDLKKQPYAGYLFAVKGLGVRGYNANCFKMNA